MITCKACGNPFEPKSVERFCSDTCTLDYENILRKVNKPLKGKKQPPVHFAFEILLSKKGVFKISQKTLDDIYNSEKDRTNFEKLLSSQDFMVVRLNQEMSVIKKSIL